LENDDMDTAHGSLMNPNFTVDENIGSEDNEDIELEDLIAMNNNTGFIQAGEDHTMDSTHEGLLENNNIMALNNATDHMDISPNDTGNSTQISDIEPMETENIEERTVQNTETSSVTQDSVPGNTNNDATDPPSIRSVVFQFRFFTPIFTRESNRTNPAENHSNAENVNTENSDAPTPDPSENTAPNRPERIAIPFAIIFEFDPANDPPNLHLLQFLSHRFFDNDNILNELFQQYQPRPAPATDKSFIEKTEMIKIAGTQLDQMCTICQEQFHMDEEGFPLPCKHMYHKDCILPWLSNHNTCPTCRYELPTAEEKISS